MNLCQERIARIAARSDYAEDAAACAERRRALGIVSGAYGFDLWPTIATVGGDW